MWCEHALVERAVQQQRQQFIFCRKHKCRLAAATAIKAVARQAGLVGVNWFTECHNGHNIKLEPAIGRLIVRDKKKMRRMTPDRQHYKLKPRQNFPKIDRK